MKKITLFFIFIISHQAIIHSMNERSFAEDMRFTQSSTHGIPSNNSLVAFYLNNQHLYDVNELDKEQQQHYDALFDQTIMDYERRPSDRDKRHTKGSSYYRVLSNSVIFYNNNNQNLFELTINNRWNKNQQECFDALIDAKQKPIKPTSAYISYIFYGTRPIKTLTYCYDNNKDLETEYTGPADIKSVPYHPDLIKPHSIIDTIKKVEEYDFFISPFLFYLKKELIYNDNGTTTEKITPQHRLVQATKVAFGLGALYATYSSCSALYSWIFKK